MSDQIQYPNRLLNKEGLSYLWTKIKSALSGKADKAPNAVEGNFASLDSNGNIKDSGHKHSDYLTSHQDISGKADKTDTVLNTTLSCGRKLNTIVGDGSFAFGYDTEASDYYTHAEGSETKASNSCAHAEGNGSCATGQSSHAEGYTTTASGNYAHAEGRQTTSSGVGAHSEGKQTNASGNYSHAEGEQTTAYAQASHVVGRYNSNDTYINWATWTANTSYEVGDKVQRVENGTRRGYVCKNANSDAECNLSNWDVDVLMNFVELVGNGTNTNNKSNARALDWNGNERIKGDLYIGCNADSTGGSKVGKQQDIDDLKSDIAVVQSNLAIVQTTDEATCNISSGQYVVWKGVLCIASTAITTGETLSVSNLTAVTDGGFNNLSSSLSTLSSTVSGIKSKTDVIGTYKSHSSSGTKNFGGTSKASGATIQLTQGVWVVHANATVNKTVSGKRTGLSIATTNNDGAYNANAYSLDVQRGSETANQYYNVAAVWNASGTTNLYAMIFNGDISTSYAASMYAVRIA